MIERSVYDAGDRERPTYHATNHIHYVKNRVESYDRMLREELRRVDIACLKELPKNLTGVKSFLR